MKICKVALNISFEGISALAVTEGACSWEELVLLEAYGRNSYIGTAYIALETVAWFTSRLLVVFYF